MAVPADNRFSEPLMQRRQVGSRGLTWLPPMSQDWGGQLLAIEAAAPEEAWSRLTALAGSQLDLMATIRLDRRLLRLFGSAPPDGLTSQPIRLAILSTSTVNHLLPALRVGALRRGLWLSTYVPDYGQVEQELSDRQSALHRYHPDTVIIIPDTQHIVGGMDAAMTESGARARLDAVCDAQVRQWRMARKAFGCRIIQQTLLSVCQPLFGSNEQRLAGSPSRLVERVNARLRDLASLEEVDLVAVDAYAAQDGIRAWHDPVLWHRAKQEIHPAATPFYGDLVARLLAAHQGRSRKCLVLDLDNTLWGGVIGDDGLEGIVLGQGHARGEAFTEFQTYVRALSRRGVILAVCSKNDENNALEPFERHPDMILRRSDIACFVANWRDKASNIQEIASRLNIGCDSLVFVDDNPFERMSVRQDLPMVAVPEMPEEPAFYTEYLADAGYFEGLHLTVEDFDRNRQYQANFHREHLQRLATDLDSHLRSLDMEMRWSRFDEVGLPRIVQLINKTNQFNLTTRRTTEPTVKAVMADPAALSLQIRLLDQFGDNGIVAAVIGRLVNGRDMLIDTWLMSCRVLGRQAEDATLNLIVAEALRLGATRLIGEYWPTAKNSMVKDLYSRLGFSLLEEQPQGVASWVLPLGGLPRPTFIRVTRVNLAEA